MLLLQEFLLSREAEKAQQKCVEGAQLGDPFPGALTLNERELGPV